VDILCRGLSLAVEDGCSCDFIAAYMFGDLFETQSLAGLGVEEGLRCCGEVGVLGALVDVSAGSGWRNRDHTSRVARDMMAVGMQRSDSDIGSLYTCGADLTLT